MAIIYELIFAKGLKEQPARKVSEVRNFAPNYDSFEIAKDTQTLEDVRI